VGRQKNEMHLPRLQQAINDSEVIIRETALWSLYQLNPPEIRRTLIAHRDDPSPSVKHVVITLLQDLQAKSDADAGAEAT